MEQYLQHQDAIRRRLLYIAELERIFAQRNHESSIYSSCKYRPYVNSHDAVLSSIQNMNNGQLSTTLTSQLQTPIVNINVFLSDKVSTHSRNAYEGQTFTSNPPFYIHSAQTLNDDENCEDSQYSPAQRQNHEIAHNNATNPLQNSCEDEVLSEELKPDADTPYGRDSPLNKSWEHRFQQLKKFQKENGHCLVPQNHPELGSWVKWLREKFALAIEGKCHFRKDQKDRLDSIGFVWRVRNKRRNLRKRIASETLEDVKETNNLVISLQVRDQQKIKRSKPSVS